VKATWKAKADELKKKHLQQNPGYSYKPRKPSEKKRRMTKRKMATMSAPVVAVTAANAQQVVTAHQPVTANPAAPNALAAAPVAFGNLISNASLSNAIPAAGNAQISDDEMKLLVELFNHPAYNVVVTPEYCDNNVEKWQQFLNESPAAKVMEQDRQEMLWNECGEWGIFENVDGSSVFQ
jgi:hypothetical protein